MDCKCKNNLERFSYICDKIVRPNRQAKITDLVKKSYHDYFGVKTKSKICVNNLMDWWNGKRMSVPFRRSGGKENITSRTAISA